MSSSWRAACKQAQREFGSNVFVPSKNRHPEQYARAINIHQSGGSGKSSNWSKVARDKRTRKRSRKKKDAREKWLVSRRRRRVIYPMVEEFKEGMLCAYYNMQTKSGGDLIKRILLLGEKHSIPSGEDVGWTAPGVPRHLLRQPNTTSQLNDYLDKLNAALNKEGRCLDVYYERTYIDNTMNRKNPDSARTQFLTKQTQSSLTKSTQLGGTLENTNNQTFTSPPLMKIKMNTLAVCCIRTFTVKRKDLAVAMRMTCDFCRTIRVHRRTSVALIQNGTLPSMSTSRCTMALGHKVPKENRNPKW